MKGIVELSYLSKRGLSENTEVGVIVLKDKKTDRKVKNGIKTR